MQSKGENNVSLFVFLLFYTCLLKKRVLPIKVIIQLNRGWLRLRLLFFKILENKKLLKMKNNTRKQKNVFNYAFIKTNISNGSKLLQRFFVIVGNISHTLLFSFTYHLGISGPLIFWGCHTLSHSFSFMSTRHKGINLLLHKLSILVVQLSGNYWISSQELSNDTTFV